MEYFTLNNGLQMPMAGIGTFMISPADTEIAVESALRDGVRLIDTANAYMNESATGRGIKNSGVAREKIFLVSKLWPTVYAKETAVDEMLARLGTDYVDLLFLHQPTANWKEGYKNIEKALTSKEKVDVNDLQKLSKQMEAMIEVARKQTLARTLKEGEDFIAEQMKADKELKQTKSGIVYKITKKGNGVNFKQDDDVMVKYKGSHIDGTVFDESKKSTPMMVSEEALIPGFVEILKLMSPGAKAHVIIPARLAYGEMGSIDRMSGVRSIKGNETLVFDIETGNIATEADLKAAGHSVEAFNQGR